MWDSLLTAVALVLVVEGVFPFLSPAGLRKTLLSMAALDDRMMRSGGLVSMIGGLILLYWVH